MKTKINKKIINTVLKKEFFNLVDKPQYIEISTDSRNIEAEQWFLALRGEKFDGHQFISSLPPVKGLIIEANSFSKKELDEIKIKFTNIMAVENTLEFFQNCAKEHVRKWKECGGVIVSITGSNGKTTNKEFLAQVLESLLPEQVYYTAGNYNNHLGVPYTCLQIQNSHQIAIVEMGTNHFGEIEKLCSIAMPDVGYITNIGDAHLENLNSREGVFREKRALFEYIDSHSTNNFKFLINTEDEHLNKLPRNAGVKELKDFIRIDESGQREVLLKGKYYKLINKNIFGDINYHNLEMVTLFTAFLCDTDAEKIIQAAEQVYPPQNNRSMWIKWKNKDLLLDAYNANPSSMQVSLDSFLKYMASKKVLDKNIGILIGDMNELGENSEEFHVAIAKKLCRGRSEMKIIFIGNNRQWYKNGAEECSYPKANIHLFESSENLRPKLEELFDNCTYIFAKASRSLKLEEIFA